MARTHRKEYGFLGGGQMFDKDCQRLPPQRFCVFDDKVKRDWSDERGGRSSSKAHRLANKNALKKALQDL